MHLTEYKLSKVSQWDCPVILCSNIADGKYTLDSPEMAITNEQSRETGNIGYTIRRKTKQKQKTICVGHHYGQTNTK